MLLIRRHMFVDITNIYIGNIFQILSYKSRCL